MNHSRLFATALVIAGMIACSPPLTDENAPVEAAKVYCKKHRSCDTDYWREDANEDMDACRTAWADSFDDWRDTLDFIGLELDLEELELCLDDIRASECYDFEEGDVGPNCADIFSF